MFLASFEALFLDFYPRSPRGERLLAHPEGLLNKRFLSTLPARGATCIRSRPWSSSPNFYPRSPRGERLLSQASFLLANSHFYPRSPRGERPDLAANRLDEIIISIHAPREGSDALHCQSYRHSLISIHAPREGSDVSPKKDKRVFTFLSTLPARGATTAQQPEATAETISIHAPREGSDWRLTPEAAPGILFLSTLPARGATLPTTIHEYFNLIFLSTLPARGATASQQGQRGRPQRFLSTLPARGAT